MRILHILDHSLPLHSGYTFRTVAILAQQRALGWETLHLTGAKQGHVRRAWNSWSTAGTFTAPRPAGNGGRACPCCASGA